MLRPDLRRLVYPVVTALAVLATAGCTPGSSSTAGSTPGGSPTGPSVSASNGPEGSENGPVVAVIYGKGGNKLALFRVGPDRRAELIRAVPSPRGVRFPGWVSLSGGADPTVCGVWFHGSGFDVGSEVGACVGPGSETPVVLQRAEAGSHRHVRGVAVRADGRAVAWIDETTSNSFPGVVSLVTADWDGEAVSNVQSYVSGHVGGVRSRRGRTLGWAGGVAWAGDGRVVVGGGYDFQGSELGPLVVDTVGLQDGWLSDASELKARKPYLVLGGVRTAGAGDVYVIESLAGTGDSDTNRALRVDLATGHTLEVISVPSPGRWERGVSGGPAGVVYWTAGDGSGPEGAPSEARFYIRFPGEEHGSPIRGLPRTTFDVIAQP